MTIPLIILCAVLLLVVFLLSLRVRLVISAEENVTLELKILFLRFRLYPKKKRIKPRDYFPKKLARNKKKEAKRALKKAKKAQKHKKAHAPSEPAVKLTLRDKLTLVRALCAVLVRRTHKHLHLHAALLHVNVATGDPATTAIAYGAVSQSMAYLLAGLDRITHLHATAPDVAVTADFLGERSQIQAHITLSARVWGLLLTAVPAFISHMNKKRALTNARRKKQQQKSPARKENDHG